MRNILITGGSHGLGREIIKAILLAPSQHYPQTIYNLDLDKPEFTHSRLRTIHCDVSDPDSIRSAFDDLPLSLDIVINNAATNHIAMLEDLEVEAWDRVLGVNAKSIFMVCKHALPLLLAAKQANGSAAILNIASDAAHRPMTGSLIYNASKAAVHIMTLQMARELGRRHGITVFGVAPNKMSGTKMSEYVDECVMKTRGWSWDEMHKYQLEGLPAHEETDPAEVAKLIAHTLSHHRAHKFLQGCILPYGG